MTQGGLNGCVSEVGRWGHRGHCQLLCLCTLGCGPAVCGRIRGRGGRHIRQRRAERLPRASVVRGGRSWREVLAGAPDGGSGRGLLAGWAPVSGARFSGERLRSVLSGDRAPLERLKKEGRKRPRPRPRHMACSRTHAARKVCVRGATEKHSKHAKPTAQAAHAERSTCTRVDLLQASFPPLGNPTRENQVRTERPTLNATRTRTHACMLHARSQVRLH